MRLLSCFFLLLGCAAPLVADNTTTIDNDVVKIEMAVDTPHHLNARHRHEMNRVMIYLDGGDMTLVYDDGHKDEQHWKPGQVAWSPSGGYHTSENVGPQPMHIVEIMLKKPGPMVAPMSKAGTRSRRPRTQQKRPPIRKRPGESPSKPARARRNRKDPRTYGCGSSGSVPDGSGRKREIGGRHRGATPQVGRRGVLGRRSSDARGHEHRRKEVRADSGRGEVTGTQLSLRASADRGTLFSFFSFPFSPRAFRV